MQDFQENVEKCTCLVDIIQSQFPRAWRQGSVIAENTLR